MLIFVQQVMRPKTILQLSFSHSPLEIVHRFLFFLAIQLANSLKYLDKGSLTGSIHGSDEVKHSCQFCEMKCIVP